MNSNASLSVPDHRPPNTMLILEITEDIVVYRYTPSKLVEYLKAKVARLASPETFEKSRTLIRNLAKEGLMEDGKESLLKSK